MDHPFLIMKKIFLIFILNISIQTFGINVEITQPVCPGEGGTITITDIQWGNNITINGYNIKNDISWNWFTGSVTYQRVQPGNYHIIATSGLFARTIYNEIRTINDSEDSEAPVFQNCPSTIQKRLSRREKRVYVSRQEPYAVDNCDGSMWGKFEYGQKLNTYFYPGVYDICYSAVDRSGNKSYCYFTIKIIGYVNQLLEVTDAALCEEETPTIYIKKSESNTEYTLFLNGNKYCDPVPGIDGDLEFNIHPDSLAIGENKILVSAKRRNKQTYLDDLGLITVYPKPRPKGIFHD